MKTESMKFEICPNCGSIEYIQDYPVKGQRICAKCGHENVEIDLKAIRTQEEWLDNCPFCGKEGEEDDTLFEDDNITVFKCKKCGKLDGYTLPGFSRDDYYDYGMPDPLSVKIAEQEGKFIHPASKYREFARELRKKERERRPIERCKKQLDLLVCSKEDEIGNAGISPETMKFIRRRIRDFIEEQGPVTTKQLNSVLAAALSLMQKSNQICCRKHLGKRVTDDQLEKIFNVTRKTIRTWRKTLQEKSFFPIKWKYGVVSHQSEEQTECTVVEIPDGVEYLTKLDKPRKDKCDFCEETEVLSWRLQYINGSWSDICDKRKTRIEPYLRESQMC